MPRNWPQLGCVFALVAIAAFGEQRAQTDSSDAEQRDEIHTLTILGHPEAVDSIPGAAQLIDAEQLARFAYTDVQRALRQVPGVSIQVEDGFGLRPNIGIRGVATERSARITLLEDGVLIAPAPYAAPAAYYFPTAGRMAALEVLKGPAAISQGPRTIGGAFNMVSTPIPKQLGGRAFAAFGQHGGRRLLASYGGTSASGFGFLVEGHQWASDGYQSIDRQDADTGLDVRDYMAKLSYEKGPHRLRLKLHKAEQSSAQSYLGLSDADFDAAPTRRYGLSLLDNIDTDHDQTILRYQYQGPSLRIAVDGYRNTFARNWFKTEGVDLDGSVDAQSFNRVSWAAVIRAVNQGAAIRTHSANELAAILNGAADTPPGSIGLRANDRRYVSQGVQARATWTGALGNATHALQVGVRYHEDEEDRLQRNSTYTQHGGRLTLHDRGLLGNAGNRIQRAQAIALFVQDTIEIGPWTLTPGLRFEDIDQDRLRYETRPGRTGDPTSRAPGNLRDTRSNRTKVLLPGFGAVYRINNSTSLIAGLHKGFSAPGNAPDVPAEEALNYEFGVRFGKEGNRVEAIGFFSDYDNLVGICTAASGGDCEVGDAFRGDAASVRGLELTAALNLAPLDAAFALPVEVAYTWTRARFDTHVADTAFFGDVRPGDPLPYIPRHQMSATAGVATERWSANAAVGYVGETCVRASCGAFEKTESAVTVDVSTRLRLRENASLFLRVENIADEARIIGRHPYGARPNKSRTATLGVDFTW